MPSYINLKVPTRCKLLILCHIWSQTSCSMLPSCCWYSSFLDPQQTKLGEQCGYSMCSFKELDQAQRGGWLCWILRWCELGAHVACFPNLQVLWFQMFHVFLHLLHSLIICMILILLHMINLLLLKWLLPKFLWIHQIMCTQYGLCWDSQGEGGDMTVVQAPIFCWICQGSILIVFPSQSNMHKHVYLVPNSLLLRMYNLCHWFKPMYPPSFQIWEIGDALD